MAMAINRQAGTAIFNNVFDFTCIIDLPFSPSPHWASTTGLSLWFFSRTATTLYPLAAHAASVLVSTGSEGSREVMTAGLRETGEIPGTASTVRSGAYRCCAA
ncbi:Uncharacterised protein [Klebsiella pneumoniae]|nr:Uncharacterised protein [Klebsiella pneumoniae]